jgi:hypothetical protein
MVKMSDVSIRQVIHYFGQYMAFGYLGILKLAQNRKEKRQADQRLGRM